MMPQFADRQRPGVCLVAISAFVILMHALSGSAHAASIGLTIDGGDAIWLAGRTDLVIPPANQPWPGGLIRHGGATPEEILETLPPGFAVSPGDVIRVLDPASGGISFFNGLGGTIYGPEGNGVPGSSSISSFGGISGYLGTQGALVGVFLSNSIPNGAAPARLDFSTSGLGTDFLSLTPALQQVFYIGNGVTSGNVFQQFVAPAGATRVFLGITDAFGFNGAPGAFDDNDGSYQIRVGINEVPTPTAVPEPASMTLVGMGIGALAYARKRRSRIQH
jgi:hypothetical protein